MTLFYFIFSTIIIDFFNAESFFIFSIKSKAFSTVILASKYFKFIYLYRCNNISFCGFNFIVCTNVGSNRWNLNFQILMKLFSKVRCELNYNYKIFSSSSSSYFLNTLWTKITITITIQVLPRPWCGSGHLYWFFHCDDTL